MIEVEQVVKYGEMGLYCFPIHSVVNGVCTCGRTDCRRAGKHPRDVAYKSKASNDAAKIRKLFRPYSLTNAGFIAGRKSDIFVVDVDGEEGQKSLAELEAKHSPLPMTRTVTSGRGYHLWFKYPSTGTVRPGREIAHKVDVRGEGDAVMLPGSIHVNGKVYAVKDESVAIATAPGWLLDKVTREDVTGAIPEGKRSRTVYKEACALFRAGQTREQVCQLIHALNSSRCNPPLPDEKINAILEKVEQEFDPDFVKKEIERPARLPWFKLSAEEVLTSMDGQSLTDYELGQRIRLLSTAWINGGKLTSDIDALARIAHASDVEAFKANWKRILYGFRPCGKKELINEGMAAEHGGLQVIIGKRREAAHIAQVRKAKKHADSLWASLPTEGRAA